MHVVLVHGLGRTVLSVAGLARSLRRAGHTTESFGYIAAVEPVERIVARLHARLERVARARTPYAVVGHSLGGLLLRAALPAVSAPPLHLVMLAPPNQPPRLARRLKRFLPFRLATGEPGQRLSDPDFFRGLPAPGVPCTVIAGTAGPRGRLSPFGDEPNDWVVAVSETRLGGEGRHVVLPVGHTFMMLDRRVRAEVLRALAGQATLPARP